MIRRTTKIVLEVLGITVAGIAVLLGLAAWRLSSGPINLDFLTPYLEEGLISPKGEFAFDVGSVVVRWGGWQDPLSLLADDVDILRADGALLARVPAMDLDLSMKALVRGRIAPVSVRFIGPSIKVVRREDGSLALGLGADGEGAAIGGFSEFLVGLSSTPNQETDSGYLSELHILNGDIDIEDRRNDLAWSVPAVNVSMQRDRLGLRVDLGFHINLDERTTTVNASGIYNRDLESIALGLSFSDFSPASLVEKFPELAILQEAQLTLGGTLSVALDTRGRLSEVGFDIESGPGFLLLTEWFPNGIVLDGFRMAGRLTDEFDDLAISEFVLESGELRVSAAGTVDGLRASPLFDVGVAVRNLRLDDFSYYWPEGVAEDPREWITENLSGGVISQAQVNVTGAADSRRFEIVVVEDLIGDAVFENATVQYLPPMPSVVGVNGVAQFALDRIVIDIDGGEAAGLQVDRGHVEIFDFENLPEKIEIDADISGPTQDALRLINNAPLNYADKMDLVPQNIRGRAAVNLKLRFPLLEDLQVEEIEPDVRAVLTNLQWQDAFRDLDVEKGRIELSVDGTKMVADATVDIYGESGTVNWTERFEDGAERPTELQFAGILNDRARADLGLDIGFPIQGPAEAELNYVALADRRETISGTIDFAPATIDIPELRWFKPAGDAAQVRLSAHFQNGRISEIRPLVVTSSDLAANLQIMFSPVDESLQNAIVNHFSFIKMDLTGRLDFENGVPARVALAGKSLDASLLYDVGNEGDDDSDGPSFEFLADIERVFVTQDGEIFLDDVSTSGRLRDGKVVDLDLKARLDAENTEISANISEDDGGRTISAESNNAGAVLRAIGIVDTFEGGTMAIRGRFDDSQSPPPLKANVEIRDYRIVRAPTLAGILTAASFVGLVDMLSGNGISFDNFDARVTMTGDEIDIQSMRAAGPGLGITGEGTYNTESEHIDLTGTIVPAYFVNSLLGNIPVVGDLLVGEKGSGVFAVSYAVRGERSNPDVSVNPLTALLPGVLRNIFDVPDGDIRIEDPVYPYDRELIRGK